MLTTIYHLSKIDPNHTLKEVMVRGWENRYNSKILKLQKSGNVRELTDRKHGCPLLLGSELDWQVQEQVNASHLNSGVVNISIVIAPGKA